MESTNFQSLQKRWPQLYEHANFAEQYVYTDAHTAIVKLRCFAEQLVGILYRELNIPCESSDGFFEKLKSTNFIEIVDDYIVEKLHAIRMLGNKAAHGRKIKSDDALALLHDAYLIGQWLFKTYSGAIYDKYPFYVQPTRPNASFNELSEKNRHLEAHLQRVKEELARLEKSERLAQSQSTDLQKSLDDAKLQAFKDASLKAASSFNLEPENTRNLIKLHDAFAEYNLTGGQSELVNELAGFLVSNDECVFLLKGYAGTGKTFITKGLTEYFSAVGRNFVLAAPTGKASKVIAKKTQSTAYTIHKTIYSLKDIVEYRDNDLDGSETYKFYAQLTINETPLDTVFIVDESSMISDIYNEDEFFRFGSGHLLRDFFKFVNFDCNNHRRKIIFIGDDAQLPPIGMNFSPALDENYLYREYGVKSNTCELIEVVRQKSDSGVVNNSIKLRESLKRNTFNKLVVGFGYPDLEKVLYEDLLNRYLDSCGNKINGESIVIAHSNADVAAYNHLIRKNFFPGADKIICGDKVMAASNSNAYGFFISNGDFGLVKGVFDNVEHRKVTLRRKSKESEKIEEVTITLVFRTILVGFKNLEGIPKFFEAKIIENLLYSEYPRLSPDESKALYLDFCIRHPELKSGDLDFKETLKSDPYFNALRLKFGYAITCHKAQGSEWNHVFVKCKTHQGQLSADYFRWFYTAITRTSAKLYLLDPPSIKIGAGIKAISSPGIPITGTSNQPLSARKLTEVNNMASKNPNQSNESFGIPPNAYFSLEILKRVRELIRGFDIDIQDVNQNQYQEVYFFRKESEVARVDISYNGKEKISRITTPSPTELSLKIIDLISSLKNVLVVQTTSTPIRDFGFEEDFLNEFHERLCPLAAQKEIIINNVESMDWKQRYTFVKGDDSAIFDIFYNGKHQFTKCSPISKGTCSSKSLSNDIQTIITEGLS